MSEPHIDDYAPWIDCWHCGVAVISRGTEHHCDHNPRCRGEQMETEARAHREELRSVFGAPENE